jgi:hypothetical protein
VVKTKANHGTVTRGFRLGKLGLSLVGSYLGYQAQNLLLGEGARAEKQAHFLQQASRRVRDELGMLKGPVMKLGQALSMQTGVLPQEVLQELADLQMRAPGMHASLARAQFKSALGKYPEEVFREFDSEPFAAASLGQVHRAITRKGETVAVKIQYPAIRSAIENDFKLLRSATFPTQLTGHVPPALLDEVQRGVLEETDYLHEADNLEYFRHGLRGLGYLTIPTVYREWTTERVLTMSCLEGEGLSQFLKRRPSPALRDLVGARLWEMYYTQLHRLKALHADHHPGNYLFRPDGGIGLVDFGCVKRIEIDGTEMHRCWSRRIWREGEPAARHFLALIYGPGVPYARARKALPLLERWADLSFPRGSVDAILDYRDPRFLAELKEVTSQYSKRVLQDKLINPEFAFVLRAEMGLQHLMHELGAAVNLGKVWRQVAGAPVTP